MTARACVLVTVLGLVGVARAQTDPADEVRERFERGQVLYEEGKLEEAAAEFRAAYALKPASALIYNEAVCYERMRDRTRAAKLFQRYLDETPKAKDRDAVAARIATLAGGGGAAAPAAPVEKEKLRGVVFVESSPPGATVYLDDKQSAPLGQTPWNGTLEGTHTVIVVAKGYRDAQKQITARSGAVSQLYMGLARDQFLGWIEVRADIPGADVYVDNVDGGAAGQTPYMANITPGKHTITVMREGFVPVARPVDVVAGEVNKIDVHLEEAPVGFVQVDGTASIGGAAVKLDGKRMCDAPCRFTAPSGNHTVSVSRSGMKTFSQRLQIAKATQTDLRVQLMPKPAKTDVIWKTALGAVFIGGGAFMVVHAGGLQDGIDADRAGGTKDADLEDRELKTKVWRYGGYAALAVGGVALVSGVIAAVSERGPRSTGTASRRDLVKVVPGPGVGGAAIQVQF